MRIKRYGKTRYWAAIDTDGMESNVINVKGGEKPLGGAPFSRLSRLSRSSFKERARWCVSVCIGRALRKWSGV